MTGETPDGFAELVGLTFTESRPGYSRGTVEVRDELLNQNGVVHGAVMSALADTGMGAALNPDLEDGELCATIELTMNYLQPVRGGTLVCETVLVNRGGSVAYLESDLTHDDETVARASGSFSIFTP